MKINLGCGGNYMQGWLNVDRWPDVNPDLLMDLEQTPWPLEDNCADEILLRRVLEHLGQSSDAFLAILREIYRISKPDAVINLQVTHPRHNDFLTDPTCRRAILPELFMCLDLATVENWLEHDYPRTPLAKYLRVDFELVQVENFLTAHWRRELGEGRVDQAGMAHAIATYNNVIEATDIRLRVRKPFKPGHALRRADAICIDRRGGLGDVLMALGAAKAAKAIAGRPVFMVTTPPFRALAVACPHVDQVVDGVAALASRYANIKLLDLNPSKFGIARVHQTDAYLQSFGLAAEAAQKEIELKPDSKADAEAQRLIASWPALSPGQTRTLLHAGQGDPNRTWPMARWIELAETLIGQGHQVVLIGGGDKLGDQGAIRAVKGVQSALDALSPLGTVALMRRSNVLVSTDSGPVQLAGATDIGIVGLYSVVAGAARLPFRHGQAQWRAQEVKPSCRFYPCYRQANNPEIMAPFDAALSNRTISVETMFANWCPDGGSFACMQQQITVPLVLDAVKRVLSQEQ